MNLLVYHWNAWNQQDIEQTLQCLGHSLTIWPEVLSNPEEEPDFEETLFRYLNKKTCDIVFSVNYFPVLSNACYRAGIPYLCWNCDGSLLSMYHQSVFHHTNRIFTFDRACFEEFRSLGVENIFHLPLGFSTNTWNITTPEHLPSNLDISFVGSLYENNSFDKMAPRLPDYLAGYLDGILNAQQNISGGNLLEAMLTPDICDQLEEITDYQKSSRSFADISKLFASTVLGFKSANLQRTYYLNILSKALRFQSPPAQIHLFTGDNCSSSLPLVKIHPEVDYHSKMPCIFQQSKINLNLTMPAIKTGIPLRIWDILGHGGFLMTDYQPELLDYFTPNEELVLFEEEEELVEKAAFYLKHEELRKKIAHQGQKIVLEHHTLACRLRQMLQICTNMG